MGDQLSGPALGIGSAAFAMICCAGLPAIGALLGGITIAGAIGVAGAVLAIAALLGGAALAVRARRRRGACPPSARERVR
jgi:hypothetical protein